MMTQEQLDNWFVYHAPTPETQPKYDAIRAAHAETEGLVLSIVRDADLALAANSQETYAAINAACKAYAVVIDNNAPDSADKTAAIRCVRLARNAANEVVTATNRTSVLREILIGELIKARWQACAAVALGGK